MKQLSSKNFKDRISKDPAWPSKLTEPLEITEFCDLSRADITALSPFLHFTGTNDRGEAADFSQCAALSIAEGTFHGSVSFERSGVEQIGSLTIINANHQGRAADFAGCKNLNVAEGIFPGYVNFSTYNDWEHDLCFKDAYPEYELFDFPNIVESGIERIANLIITQPDNDGYAARFNRCANLKVAEGTFTGFVDFRNSGIEKIGELTITQPNTDGQYAKWEETLILQTNPQSVVNRLWGNKSIPELREIHSKISQYEQPIKAAIDALIQQRKAAMEKQESAVEIQID